MKKIILTTLLLTQVFELSLATAYAADPSKPASAKPASKPLSSASEKQTSSSSSGSSSGMPAQSKITFEFIDGKGKFSHYVFLRPNAAGSILRAAVWERSRQNPYPGPVTLGAQTGLANPCLDFGSTPEGIAVDVLQKDFEKIYLYLKGDLSHESILQEESIRTYARRWEIQPLLTAMENPAPPPAYSENESKQEIAHAAPEGTFVNTQASM